MNTVKSKEEVRAAVRDCAFENFKSGLNCAESVYDALIRGGALDVAPETCAMVIGFGGGIGLCGYTCGALSAAIMANGAVYGRPDPWVVDPDIRGDEISEKYYRRYNNMVQDFIKAHGAVLCKDLCAPYDDWHSKERRKMCMKLTADAAVMAYDYLLISQDEAFMLPYAENMGGEK